eukprot:411743-Pelagomonas_calceolata.AAC.8
MVAIAPLVVLISCTLAGLRLPSGSNPSTSPEQVYGSYCCAGPAGADLDSGQAYCMLYQMTRPFYIKTKCPWCSKPAEQKNCLDEVVLLLAKPPLRQHPKGVDLWGKVYGLGNPHSCSQKATVAHSQHPKLPGLACPQNRTFKGAF